MPSTSDQRALATSLGALSDADLSALLHTRGVAPDAPWRDLFDAADALLDPASIARGLAALAAGSASHLSRAVLDDTFVDAAYRIDLVRAALAGADGEVYHAVRASVAERGDVRIDPPMPAGESSTADAAAAAERAFTQTASLADILLRALETPLARIGTGEMGATDRRALVEAGAVADGPTADVLVALASTVGLLAGGERAWTATDEARAWLLLSTTERWRRVAVALRDALPAGVRSVDGGWMPVVAWPGAYPYDPSWPARAEEWRIRLHAWGVIDDAGGVPPWAVTLARGEDADIRSLAILLPGEVDRVYLQNDLTAIAPGPLAPHLDVRLRRMAHRESRAQASSYRFDAESVSAAIASGETAESLRDFLGGISLTGLPQPLAYVIDRAAERYGRVRVSTDLGTGRARVSSDEADAIDTIAVDQSLRALGLVRDGAGLVSRVPADAVFWALTDARYPAVAVDADGAPLVLDRSRVSPAVTAARPGDAYAALLARLREASAADGDAAWLERELDQAVRARAIVDVVVSLPDGTTRTFRLEATGFGGGRLRGRDRGADVERTLPLSRIVSVHPAA